MTNNSEPPTTPIYIPPPMSKEKFFAIFREYKYPESLIETLWKRKPPNLTTADEPKMRRNCMAMALSKEKMDSDVLEAQQEEEKEEKEEKEERKEREEKEQIKLEDKSEDDGTEEGT